MILLRNLRYGVVEIALVKGIAAQQPLESQPAALYGTVFVDSFIGISRAGRTKTAGWRRARGDLLLIKTNEGKKYLFHRQVKKYTGSWFQTSVSSRGSKSRGDPGFPRGEAVSKRGTSC